MDLGGVKGSGPHGRIIARMSRAANRARRPSRRARPRSLRPWPRRWPTQMILKLFEPGTYELVPHDGMRKIIARRLTGSQADDPAFLSLDRLRRSRLCSAARKPQRACAARQGGTPAWKLSVNDFVIKALALALKRVPDANATWTEAAMLKHKHADVGVAVAIGAGCSRRSSARPKARASSADLASR